MPRVSYGDDNELIFRSKYSHEGAYGMDDIFGRNYKTSRLVGYKKHHSSKDYGKDVKYLVARMVFYDFILVMLEQLTYGGIFMFPGTSGAHIVLRKHKRATVNKLVDLGIISKQDMIRTNYVLPYFEFNYGPNIRRKPKMIKVPEMIMQKAYDNVLAGKVNWTYYETRRRKRG